MKKVNIPYTLQESPMGMQLVMPSITFPSKCPCCGSTHPDRSYTLDFKARHTSSTVGTASTSTYYPLSWQVPFCRACLAHVKKLENLTYIIIAACILLPIILPIVFGFVSYGLLIVAVLIGCIILGVVTYQIALRLFIRPKMSRSCAHHRYPLFATDAVSAVEFNYYNDAIAEEFALLNHREAVPTEKPNFWKLKGRR